MSKKLVITIIGLSVILGYLFGELNRIERVEQVSRVDKPLSAKKILEQKFATVGMAESALPLQNNDVNVINFWATWCPPCKKEIPIFNKKFATDFEKGVGIIGIALDEEDHIKDFIITQPIDYPHFFGQQNVSELMSYYGNSMGVLPFTVFTNSDGQYLSSVVGEVSYESLSNAILDAQKLIEKSQ